MSENILKALMQLFAIIASPAEDSESKKELVKAFLNRQLNSELVNEYLIIYDQYLDALQKRSKRKNKKRTVIAASSVKVLKICTKINTEITKRQKVVVLIRLLEFINTSEEISEQEYEFLTTVAEIFHLTPREYQNLLTFILDTDTRVPDFENMLVINNSNSHDKVHALHLQMPLLEGQILVYRFESANLYIFTYKGDNELQLNGQIIHNHRAYVLATGSSIRNTQREAVYYSDIVRAYSADENKHKIIFEVNNLTYRFKNGAYGLHKTNFKQESGNLIGIMGASGAGKSTLLGTLNGSLIPTTGAVTINGIDIHSDSKKIEGVIGHVSQDDLLIEDLTVFENLFYNAKLCFSGYTKPQLYRVVLRTLMNLGLYSIKDMKVGSPLNKKISGGQRKRLNIALELIREPSILFLDEPTSGLSSRDSEIILDLLKELTLRGKLIFVVIHQPSSDIFKMFDKLLLLDTGGYMIYNEDPVEAIVYFKSKIKQADWNESECHTCGNVNPEQIFNIIEGRVLDEYGSLTQTRKTAPAEWYSFYNKHIEQETTTKIKKEQVLPANLFKIPGRLSQTITFIQRDILSKFANKQYMLINLLEAPILAGMLSFIIKYFDMSEQNKFGYSLSENSNLPVYIFMSVIVAVFIGLTISAQEIIKDRKILKRESFLNLSRSSYLISKVAILFLIGAYQALTYVLMGNLILEIKGMFFDYWLILFSTWAFSILLGLNISDGFKTSITIYIIIPFLLIPQIILSGIIVKYEKLNPHISSPESIPWFGEIITARWAYEALAVNQYIENAFMSPVFKYQRAKENANFKKDFWRVELINSIDFVVRNKDSVARKDKINGHLALLKNEILKEEKLQKKVVYKDSLEHLKFSKIKTKDIKAVKTYLKDIQTYYSKRYNLADKKRDSVIISRSKGDLKKSYEKLKREHFNSVLENFVRNSDEPNKIIRYKNQLYKKADPIYTYPQQNFKSHFYAPKKMLFGRYYDTFWVNTGVLWGYTIIMFFTLYYSLLRKTLDFSDYIQTRKKHKEE